MCIRDSPRARRGAHPPRRRPARLPATPWRVSPPRSGARARRSSAWGARSWRTPPPCSPAGSRARTKEDGATLVGTVPDRTRDGATRTTANGMVAIRSVLTLRARTRKRRKPRQELACRDRVTWTSARWTHATSWTLEHTSRTLRIPPRGTSTCGRATSGGGRSGGWRPLRRARSPCIAARPRSARASASICQTPPCSSPRRRAEVREVLCRTQKRPLRAQAAGSS